MSEATESCETDVAKELSIFSYVQAYCKLGFKKDEIIHNIMKKFQLTETEAIVSSILCKHFFISCSV